MNPLAAFEKQLIPEEEIARLMKSGDKTPAEMMAYLEKVEIPYIWQPAIEAAADKDIKAARINSNAMIELVMTDKAQKSFKQERAHIRIQELLMRTFESGLRGRISPSDINELRNLLLEMPFESGKTQQLVGFMLWLFGQDQGITGAYIRAKNLDAMAVVGQVAGTMHLSKIYKEIFPEVKVRPRDARDLPGKKREFTLAREGTPPDPTLTAGGMDEAPEGKRWDFVILDDPSTIKTAYSETRREKSVDIFREAIRSRLDKEYGFWVCIGQERHPEDILAWIKKNEKFNHIHEPIMTDINDYSTCQFPGMFSEASIKDQKRDMSKFLKFQMLQRGDPDEQKRREEAIQIAIDRAEFEGHRLYEHYVPKPHEILCAGFDLPHKKKRKGGKPADSLAGYVQRYDPLTGDQITIGMRMQKGGIFEILEFIVKMCRDFGLTLQGPRMIVVENVGAQDYVNQIFTDPIKGIVKTQPEFRRLKVEAYTTNEDTKFYDIPSVHTLYENGHEVLPDSEITKSYKAGLIAYQTGDHPHDLLMARVCSDHGIEILREKYKNMYTEKLMTYQPDNSIEKHRQEIEQLESMYDPGTAAVVGAVY